MSRKNLVASSHIATSGLVVQIATEIERLQGNRKFLLEEIDKHERILADRRAELVNVKTSLLEAQRELDSKAR